MAAAVAAPGAAAAWGPGVGLWCLGVLRGKQLLGVTAVQVRSLPTLKSCGLMQAPSAQVCHLL
jgi:hypothetical protein